MIDVIETAAPLEQPKKSYSKIWILPILAALIGVGMVFNDWRNRGVNINISFNTAAGLEADKTVVKFRDVDIGIVKEVGFNSQRDGINVNIEIAREMADLLKKDTQFWVVKPRFSAAGISGIGTLLSGNHIQISPGSDNEAKFDFIGLELPPITSPNANGLHVTLQSKGGKPISVGSRVVYHGFNVGKIESFVFNPTTRDATYEAFISAPYDALVTSNTIFWNAGGIKLLANAEGIEVNVASIETLLDGGVEFDVPEGQPLGDRITQSQTFNLYQSRDGIDKNREYRFFEYLVMAEDSVGGLYEGAPVEYLGVRLGTVAKPFLTLDTELAGVEDIQEDPRIPILLRIEPERVYTSGNVDIEKFRERLEEGMLKGTVATIKSANLLTGSLKISLDPGGKPVAALETYGKYKVIPSKRGGVSEITDQVQSLLSKVSSLPLEKTIDNTNKAITNADTVLLTLNQSLKELQTTLKGFQPDSAVYESLNSSVVELQSTLQSVKPLLRDLNNKPSSLIFSGTKSPDVEPKAESK